MNPTPGRRPDWVSAELYPYTSRFIEVDGHVVHYIDEGAGPVLLFLHGNPVWSFLYRQVIGDLSERFRCVALDLPGFGLSSAADGYGYRPSEHATVVEGVVSRLGLSDATMVVNDWGGPIGLSVAAGRPDVFTRLVIANTWAWSVRGDRHFEVFSWLMGGPIGRVLIARFNLFVNQLIPRGHSRRRPTAGEMAHYRGPFPTPASRRPTSIFPRQITRSHAWLERVERGLDRLAQHPVLLVWGEADIAFRARERERFERLFPRARTVRLPGVGHFVASDAPADMSAAIRAWHPHTAVQGGLAGGSAEG